MAMQAVWSQAGVARMTKAPGDHFVRPQLASNPWGAHKRRR